ncbi:Uncharacterised protein [Serratia fonticola]|uniref:Uncharacterized protein n=1 Tax=Serratia fonticola TaxID=47917 RepID=A0A4U9WD42_SERFO|nr:Uncharacterised protein [Serratia fonticola]
MRPNHGIALLSKMRRHTQLSVLEKLADVDNWVISGGDGPNAMFIFASNVITEKIVGF